MTDMPDGTLYGTITGSVSAFIGDTESDTNDLPDRVPVPTGSTISFEPSISYVIVESSPKRDIIFATPETVMLDDDGGFSVKLVACDSPNLNPSGWYYTVRLNVPGRAALTARVQVPGGQSITLGEAIGAAQPGTAIVKVEGPAGPPGHTPTVAMTGDQLVIDGVVVGPHLTGPPGPASKLTVGTVTTGAPGSQAAATLTGAAPNQVLDLTIPQGPKGDPDAASSPNGSTSPLTGTGFPAAGLGAVGDTYIDTAATAGVLVWRKWPTGWRVQEGDTGWRRLPTLNGWGGSIVVRRVNSVCHFQIEVANGADPVIASIPTGFMPRDIGQYGRNFWPALSEYSQTWGAIKWESPSTLRLDFRELRSGFWYQATFSYATDQTWPTTPPGTPVN